MDRDDISLPKATVNKVIKDCAPPELKIANDARDLISEASIEFLQLISSEANELCTKDNKTIILGEHIIKALESLGFTEYLDEVKEYYEKQKKDLAEKPKFNKRLGEGMTEEDLIAQQQALFEKAKSALGSQ